MKKKTSPAKQEMLVPGTEETSKSPEKVKRARGKRLIALAAVVAVLLIALVVWGGPLEVQAEQVAAAPFDDTFTETGIVKGGTARDHMSPASGRVAEVYVQKNSTVKAGDALVRIDAAEVEYELQSHRNALSGYRAQLGESIRSLRAELGTLQAERSQSVAGDAAGLSPEAYLESLKAKAEAAQTQLQVAETERDTARALYEIGAESRVGVEEAEKTYLEAKSESDALSSQYTDARAHLSGGGTYYGALNQSYAERIQAAQAQLNDYLALAATEDPAEDYGTSSLGVQMAEEASRIRQLEEKLDRCTVRALCDGIVSDLPAEALSDVAEGELIATVREKGDFTLEVNVLTSEEPFLRVGDAVTLTQKLKGQQTLYEGRITEIGGYAEKTLSVIGAEEYRVRVMVTIPETEGLKEGYELEARFTTYHSDAALTVPNSALFKADGYDCVFVISGMTAKQRSVEIAHKASIRTELAAGVSAGERIVADANVEGLEDGSIVLASGD